MNKRLNVIICVGLTVVLAAGPLLNAALAQRSFLPSPPARDAAPTRVRPGSEAAKATKAKTPATIRSPRLQQTANPAGQTSTLLPNGSSLLIGGEGPDGPLATVSLRNAQGEEVTSLARAMTNARAWHTSTLLPDGTVLIAGGVGADARLIGEVELFDPTRQSFDAIEGARLARRAHHTATLLTDGRVLIAGGVSSNGRPATTAELWDFKTRTVTRLPARLSSARQNHTAALLPGGGVLLWGGLDANGAPLNNGELYDPRQESFTLVDSPPTRDSRVLRVEGSMPEDSATDVPVDALLSLRFTRPLRVETINPSTVVLTSPFGQVAARVVPAEAGMLAFVTPEAPLIPGAAYTLSIAGSTEAAGLPVEPSSISFITVAGEVPRGRVWVPDERNFNGDWTSGLPPSQWQDLPPRQAEPGVTALAGQVLRVDGWPISDVVMRIGDRQTKTDAGGQFLLTGIESGRRTLIVDCRPASTKKTPLGFFMIAVDVPKSRETNVLPYTIWMPVLDTRHAIHVGSPTRSDVVARTPLLPELEVHIPRGTVLRDVEGKAIKTITITPVPVDRGPFPGPVGVSFPMFFTLQLGGTTLEEAGSGKLTSGMKLVFPNYGKVAGGTRIDFWGYDAGGVGWYTYGHGTVRQDGKQIVPDPGVTIHLFTCASIGSPTEPEGPPPCNNCGTDGDPVDLSTGLFVYRQTDLVLPDIIPISLTRIYRPNDTKWRPFGTGARYPYEMFLVGDQTTYSYAELILPDGGKIRFDRYSPGTGPQGAIMEATKTPTAFYKATLTAYDVGGATGRWDIRLKDGTIYRFALKNNDAAPLTAIIDRNGNQLSVVRTTGGGTPDLRFNRVTKLISPNGRWVEFTYDASLHVTQAKDNIGRTVNYAYDPTGRLMSGTDPMGGVTEYTWDAANRMRTIKDARGIVYLTNDYDTNGRVVKQTQADGSTYQFAYTLDGSGKVTQTSVTDPRGNPRTVTFNGDGYTVTDTRGCCAGQMTTFVREPVTNRVLSVTDGLGRKTDNVYDSKGNVTSVTELAGTSAAITATFTYEPQYNQLASVTDPLSHTMSYAYDSKANLISATDALGHQATSTSNSAGQTTSATDAIGNTTTFAYEAGDLVQVTNPLGQSATRFIDAAGRLLSATNALGQTVRIEYDALNRPTRVTDPLEGATQFAFDANSNLLSVTDARNNTTSYSFDSMDRVATRGDPLGRQETYLYDANGNLTRVTDRKGQVTQYEYDELDRLELVTYGDGSTIAYSYDQGNRLTQAVDSISGTISYSYDGLDRVIVETTPEGAVSYSYDGASRLLTMAVAGQPAVTYAYDNADRLTQITQGSSTVTIAYDIADRRTSLTLPNGVVTEYGYDIASRLTGLTYKKSGLVLGNLTYDYDSGSRVSKLGGTFARTNLPQAVSSTNYNAANHQLAFGSQTLTYDLNGNLTSDGVNSYTWNARDQLASISGPGLSASFQYDAFGRRVGKTMNGVATGFLYDGDNIVQETAGSVVTANQLTGGIDEVFLRSDSTGSWSPIVDTLGSTWALTDSAGAIQTRYTYEPFGKTTSTGVPSTTSSQYTGRENDGTGLFYYRARYYSPTQQRFISEDPAEFEGEEVNLYSYVGNSPINFIDPLGLEKQSGPWISEVAFCRALGVAGTYCAGFADTIDFGLSDTARDWSGANSAVDKSHGAYTAGEVTGYAWEVAMACATGGAAAEYKVTFNYYRNAKGVGMNVLKRGKRCFAADWHRFKSKSTGKIVNRPHLHWGKTKSQMKKHRSPITGKPM